MIENKIYLKSISYILMFIFISVIIPLHLFQCFIAGFLSYEIIISLTPYFERFIGNGKARWIVIIFIAIFIVMILTFSIISFITLLKDHIKYGMSISYEIERIIYDLKNRLPVFFISFLPETTEELKEQIFSFIESNLINIRNTGKKFLHWIITIFIGLIIGAIISLNKPYNKKTYFIVQMLERIRSLSKAFRNIVFAQIKISLVNTLFTSVMILILFPIFGIHLPIEKTLIFSTFIFGLFPIIGNLISNSIIIISSLSISIVIGGIMVIYLILIHKLEYFLNAEIVGNSIQAKSWELLLSMLILEAIFGFEGLIAAPIYYAYLKIELRSNNLI